MQEQSSVCAVCGVVATLKCSGCQAVYYCSQKHQKLDWKTHSKICRTYKFVESPQLGRHLVATRNIKIGELVVCDKAPLITLPSNRGIIQNSGPGFLDVVEPDRMNGSWRVKIFDKPVCLSCYVELRFEDAKPCVKCGWPLCRKCTNHGTECEFTMKHRTTKVNILKKEYGQFHAAYEIIGVIRALALRENDPEAYRKLINLRDHSTEANDEQINRKKAVDKTARFAKTFLKIEGVEVAEICKLIRITMYHSVHLSLKGHAYSAIYDCASYIEHNCRGNCSLSFTTEEGIICWAAVPISKGDHISISHVCPFWTTKKRREYLMVKKFIDCRCERCTDPTEFGTMFNAIKCFQTDCNGYALTLPFLVPNERCGDFVCLKCKKAVPRQLTDCMVPKVEMDRSSLEINSINQCENFIETWREYLHKSNSYIFEVELRLTFAILCHGENLKNKPKEYWRTIFDLCTRLTEGLQILAPAENVARAAVLYLKFRATTMLSENDSMTLDKQIDCAKMLWKDLRQGQELLRREPACLQFEQDLLKNIRQGLEELEKFEIVFSLARTT